jgi:hypothetical protein
MLLGGMQGVLGYILVVPTFLVVVVGWEGLFLPLTRMELQAYRLPSQAPMCGMLLEVVVGYHGVTLVLQPPIGTN